MILSAASSSCERENWRDNVPPFAILKEPMEKSPKWNVTDTSYGPHLTRVRTEAGEEGEQVDDNREPDLPGELTPRRRYMLRNTLAALGIALVPAEIAEEPRQGFLSDRTATIESNQGEFAPERAPVPVPRPQLSETSVAPVEAVVEFMSEPERRIEGYAATWTIPYDQVLFVDNTNRPVGTVPLSVVYEEQRTKDNGEPFLYANTSGYGGGLDFPKDGIPGEWLRATREKLSEQYPDTTIGDQYNVIQSFLAALREDDEPVLIEKIKSGEITTVEGIVRYFADKPVVGAEDYSRLEYVYEKIEFPDYIPQRVQEELRRLVPGLAAQESKFNNGLTSSAGAKGIFQFMPATWSGVDETNPGLGMKPEEIISLKKQVEGAGQHFGNIYRELHSAIHDETQATVRSWYESEEAYEAYFLAPLMVTAYNVGGSRMAEAVEAFVAAHPSLTDAPDNLATFFALTDFAKESKAGRLAEFDTAGASYYPKVEGAAAVFTPQP